MFSRWVAGIAPEVEYRAPEVWQIWNEQNGPKHAHFPNPGLYAELVKISHEAISSQDPSIEVLLGGMYGNALHVWDLNSRRHRQKLELGPEYQMVLELRPAHNPNETYGFAGVVTSLKVATEVACTRIARYAFRYATRRHRKKITVFHKANIMKLTDGMFLRAAKRIHEEEYPNITINDTFTDYPSYWEKRQTEAAGGGLPDVMQFDYSYLRQYSENGLLLDLGVGFHSDGNRQEHRIACGLGYSKHRRQYHSASQPAGSQHARKLLGS